VTAAIEPSAHPREQIERGREVCFQGPPGGTLARTEHLDLAIAQQLEQLKTFGKAHVPHIIAGLAEIL
jgi:hypothetical protein